MILVLQALPGFPGGADGLTDKSVFAGPSGPSKEDSGIRYKMASDTKHDIRRKKRRKWKEKSKR